MIAGAMNSLVNTLIQDVRFGFRVLARSPGFTMAAVLTLALGIGANTAIFSAVNAVLLRPLPFPHPERLIRVFESSRRFMDGQPVQATLVSFRAWHSHSRTLERIAAFESYYFVLTGAGDAEKLLGAIVSEDFFPLLGVKPFRGRFFTAAENQPGNDGVVVLSHAIWQRRFGEDPGVIGRQLILNGRPHTVIGVLPPAFHFIPVGDAEVWAPVSLEQPEPQQAGGKWYLDTIGRLRPGTTAAQAGRDLDALVQEASNGSSRAIVSPLDEELVGGARRSLLVLFGAVGFVLLIACANVANLQLARATARTREIAIRIAIGASSWRVMRQLLIESALLALAGGFAGLFLAWWGTGLLVSLGASEVPRADEIGIDGWVLAFTFAASVAAGMLFGFAAAVQASRTDLNFSLKAGNAAAGAGGWSNRLRGALVVGEVAVALMLLIGAGLMIDTLWRLRHAHTGFVAKSVLTMEVELPWSRYPGTQAAEFYRSVLERLKALHGVRAAGFVNTLPMGGYETFADVLPEGASKSQSLSAQFRSISPGYFQTMGIPLRQGRFFTDRDVQGRPRFAIVNETLARRYFAGRALGRRISQGRGEPWIEIAGIVGDIRFSKLSSEPMPEVYYPVAQEPRTLMWLAVRTAADPLRLVASIRSEIQAVDRDVPVGSVMTMDERVSKSLGTSRFLLFLLIAFAGVALLLAGVGAYGVMSYSVAQRTHEIGVRVAVGARGEDILALVVKHGLRLTVLGVAIGLAASFAVTRVLLSFLYGVSPTDPVTLGAASLVMAGVALVASYMPARRAAKVDPIVALRQQ
jgi:putative ABC transport system permease protein